jgi:hypothetical protein
MNKPVNLEIKIFTLIFIILLTLKLTKIGIVANWPWIWILSPLWIPITIAIFAFIIFAIISLIFIIWTKKE